MKYGGNPPDSTAIILPFLLAVTALETKHSWTTDYYDGSHPLARGARAN